MAGRLSYVLRSIWQEDSNRGQRLRRVFLFFAWQLWKRLVTAPWKVRLFNGLRICVWRDCDTSPAAIYYCIPNGKHLSFLRSCLDGGTFVDVGANVGLVSLLVADKVKHAILFEPNPTVAKRAELNLQMNGLQFEVCVLALSDKIGTVEFENLVAGSSCNRTVEGFTTSAPTIMVPRTTLDQFLREHEASVAPIDAVKIDVEGHENSVLRGMTGALRDQRPKLVMFEYLERTNILEVLATFHGVGYSVFELSGHGPRRVTTNDVHPLQDLFACPDERTHEFGI